MRIPFLLLVGGLISPLILARKLTGLPQCTEVSQSRQDPFRYSNPRKLTSFSSAVGKSLLAVVIGRLVSGLGGGGMDSLVSILITGKLALYSKTICTF